MLRPKTINLTMINPRQHACYLEGVVLIQQAKIGKGTTNETKFYFR